MAESKLYAVEHAGRRVPLLLPEDFAQAQGLSLFNPAPPPVPGVPDARLAFTGDTPMAGTGSPPNVPDVPPNMGAGGAPGFVPSSGGAGGAAGGNMAGTMGSAGSEKQEERAEVSTEKSPAAKGEKAKGRPALKTTEIEVPDEYAGTARQRSPGRVMKIKGGDVRAAFTRKPGMPLPEGHEEERQLTDNAQDIALLQGANAQLDAGQVQRAMFAEREKRLLEQEDQVAAQQAKRARIDQEIAQRHQRVQEREAEAEQLAGKPTTVAAFWEDRGVAAQILGAIAVGLGASSQALGGGENAALRMQEKAIDAWVQDKRAKYEASRDRVSDAKGAYADALEQWGTPEAAEEDLRMRAHAVADAQFAVMAQRAAQQSGDAELMAGVQAELANRRQARLDRKLELQKRLSGEVIEQWQNVPDRYVQFGGGSKPKDIDRMVRLPNGEYAWARTEAQAKEAQNNIASNAAVAEAAARIERIRQTPESRMPLSEKRAQIETAAGDLFLAIKSGANLGTLDKGALDFREEYIGKPDALLSPGADAKLRELGRGATKKVQDTAQYYLHADPDAIDPVTGPRPQSARSDE